MYTFSDFYKNKVTLSFSDHPFSQQPKHVLIVCRYKDNWLLTHHKERGLEFPGGKVERGETAKEGAIREVKEETGAVVGNIHYVGQYFVAGKGDQIVKNLYFAEIEDLIKQETYFETKGPVLLESLPANIKYNSAYSFIMKDDVIVHAIDHIKRKWIESFH